MTRYDFFLVKKMVPLQIIFENISDVDRTTDILNSLKNDINKALCGIEFVVAEKGSIVLNVDLRLDMLETDERLQSILALLLEEILNRMTLTVDSIDIVLILVEGLSNILL